MASSIRARVVLLAILAMAPLLAERIETMEGARSERMAAAGRHARELARAGAERQNDILTAARALLQSIGQAVARVPPNGRECNRLLADIASDVAWARALMVAEPQGRVLCSSHPQKIGTDLTGADYFRAAAVAGGLAVSDPFVGPGAGPELSAAYGWRGASGQVSLVLVAEMDMREIGELPPALERRPDALVLLVDSVGMVAAGYPEKAYWTGLDLTGSALMRAVETQGAGTVVTRDGDGIARIWGFQPLPSGRGHLLVGFDARKIGRTVEREMMAAYGQLALAVALMLLGAWFFGERTILQPVRRLARHAERIGRGDLAARAGGPPWATEFLPLVRALDSMAARLREREHDLQSQSEHFRTLASLDSLTGLSNRRAFDQHIAAAWQRAQKARRPLTLLMIDVDHFKRFNDHYGHLCGDECLRTVGCILRAMTGPDVRAARYGGEEFALLMSGPVADPRQIAETICQVVADLRIPHAQTPGGFVTVSIGVATLTPERGMTFNALIEAADAALYESKSRRNTVTLYAPRPLAAAG